MVGATGGGEGLNQPPTDGTGYGSSSLEQNDATRVLPADLDTGTYSVRAPTGNSGPVFIGWDGDVDDASGFPLYAEDAWSVDIDNASQNLYAYTTNAGDELRYIATN